MQMVAAAVSGQAKEGACEAPGGARGAQMGFSRRTARRPLGGEVGDASLMAAGAESGDGGGGSSGRAGRRARERVEWE